jgi:2-oxoglutarate dehydrogenase E1 component
VELSLLANPSHLEAVNPLVVGKAKCKMVCSGDEAGDKTMGIILHGDAAMAGQGVVYETMQMSQLEDYQTGGTIHIIANNQVGFTTDPWASRSSMYCSDIGKAFEAPIWHVNADHPEEVVRVFKLAAEYRAAFKTDVVIDVIGYRRYGHNELDQPSFTQPVMYKKVSKHPTGLTLYQESLVAKGQLTKEEVDGVYSAVDGVINAAFKASGDYVVPEDTWFSERWEGLYTGTSNMSKVRRTGIGGDMFDRVGAALHAVPGDMKLHRNIAKVIKSRGSMIENGVGIDWGTAEALAFGSLLEEGKHVRLSGQDAQRGTFSHRHSVVHDQDGKGSHTFLNHISEEQNSYTVCNSPLSEYGVLGFELGYSQEDPHALVLWEAQFGDFSNTAQVIFDQFLSSGESKWLRQSGLVCLLPHGYEGQGPEHSSCRVERFLQMSDEDADIVPEMAEDNRTQIQRYVSTVTEFDYGLGY